MILIEFNLKHERDTMTFCLDLFFVLSSSLLVGGKWWSLIVFSVWTGRLGSVLNKIEQVFCQQHTFLQVLGLIFRIFLYEPQVSRFYRIVEGFQKEDI